MKAFLDRARRSARFRLDKLVAPPRNARLNARFDADPQAVLTRVDAAIDRALAWLAPQEDVSTSVLLCAARTLRRTGDQRFAFYAEKSEHYRATLRDPALRMFFPDYDPDARDYAHLPDVMQVRPYVPVELLMLDTVWADKRPQPDILDRLAAFDDEGNYGTTHIVVGGILLLDNGGAPADRTRALIDATIPSIVLRNRTTTRIDDIYAERCMVLAWLDRPDLIEPAWIMQLLDAQLPDGGWGSWNFLPLWGSNQHTVAVATAALGEFLAYRRGRQA